MGSGSMSPPGVKLQIQDHHVVIDNGILQVTLSKPEGMVTGISYKGIDNLLEVKNGETKRGYMVVVWDSLDGRKQPPQWIFGTKFEVIKETEEQVEVSFSRTWDSSLKGKLVPLNVDKRFIVLRGSSGFYWYAICEHLGLPEWPAFGLNVAMNAFVLLKEKFHYMAVADNRRRFMPLPDDRDLKRCQPLAYEEAVLLVDPKEPEFKGQVDDKYQYSCDNKDLRVHGWISMASPDSPPVGFWQITPSDEFRTGGPLKQNLSSHVFISPHYAGEDLELKIGQGEAWKKVFGPVFVHLNSVEGGKSGDEALTLWEGAKRQMMAEVQSWPYTFPESDDFPSSDQRGNVSGRLVVRDRYISKDYISANGAYVGLAPPGDVGSWQRECKGYQFWTRTDEHGYFSINHIRTGDYNLYAWVPGFIGDYRKDNVVTITPGCHIPLGNLVYEPPRDGPTLWEIGIPDRSAAEFYVPDPDPKYINPLFVNHPDRFRQYGLWERYAELYPKEDLVYTVGVSDYRKDWFFAQVTRRKNDNTYQGTTWQIKFKLDMVDQTGTYKLRVALAAANLGELQVRVNDPNPTRPLFSSGLIGRDNVVARHGIHGLYWLFNVEIPNAALVKGEYNTIYLTQPRGQSSLQNLMYDYIRLEGPPTKGHQMSYL
ncbi:probable rhamnogalacturonate lyase B isoform X2 [Rhododendron vialii]|uniref:probable rhamnogalacturonate lyase B isoform X2 n=1 Tax=Rhododendron vialii TaxID=182163 RepID=UPI00265DECCB|nr:probable rhamnogalacturonate lyase B isoform X2 [Rhododendron vialii]